jgi:hypothetical protein
MASSRCRLIREALTVIACTTIVTARGAARYQPEGLRECWRGANANPQQSEKFIIYSGLCYIQSATYL